MDRVLVVIFDQEDKAYEGKEALLELDREGNISLYAYSVIAKGGDGVVTTKQGDDLGPLGTLSGTAFGSLIGLLGGAVGLAVGATAGLLAGATADLHNARVGDDFLYDVSKALLPHKFAVVAEVDEDWTTPVDTRMEAIGGTVYRRALSEVNHTVHDENVAAMKADLAQMKAEHAEAHAGRKEKLQEKISQLDSKLQASLQKAKDKRYAAALETQAKADVLKAKAAKAKANV